MPNSIVGLLYKPKDNSYQVNITRATHYPYVNKERYLAGTIDTPAKTCVILTEPFVSYVITPVNTITTVPVIAVEYDNETHIVMYHAECVIHP
jgi:hypothetical protein